MDKIKFRFGAIIFMVFLFTNLVYCQTDPDHLLLKNYRPKSIYNVPYVVVEKAKHPVIDMNSHPYAESEKQLDEWVHNMDQAGIRKTIILTDTYGKKFDSLITFYSKYPDRFILFCGFDLAGYDKPGFGPAAVKELKRCHEEGARGVGELIDKSRGFVHSDPPAYWMHIDDPRMDPLLDECSKLGMPVSISIGEPQWFYESLNSGNDGLMKAYKGQFDMGWDLNLDQELNHLGRGVARHPKTIFIASHFANQVTDLAKLGKLFDKYPNLYADISDRYAEVATIPIYTKAIMEKYKNKLLYGTDMGFDEHMYHVTFTVLETGDEHFYHIDLFNYEWPLYGLELGSKSLKKIYWDNAAKILKVKD